MKAGIYWIYWKKEEEAERKGRRRRRRRRRRKRRRKRRKRRRKWPPKPVGALAILWLLVILVMLWPCCSIKVCLWPCCSIKVCLSVPMLCRLDWPQDAHLDGLRMPIRGRPSGAGGLASLATNEPSGVRGTEPLRVVFASCSSASECRSWIHSLVVGRQLAIRSQEVSMFMFP